MHMPRWTPAPVRTSQKIGDNAAFPTIIPELLVPQPSASNLLLSFVHGCLQPADQSPYAFLYIVLTDSAGGVATFSSQSDADGPSSGLRLVPAPATLTEAHLREAYEGTIAASVVEYARNAKAQGDCMLAVLALLGLLNRLPRLYGPITFLGMQQSCCSCRPGTLESHTTQSRAVHLDASLSL